MNKKQLTLTSAFVIYESKLPKQAKLQLMKFIKNEATDSQLKAFLLDGEIIPKIDSITEEIINDRFLVSEAGGRVATLRKSYMTQAGAGGGLSPIWLKYRAIRSMFDKCTRQCGVLEINTVRRQLCMAKCKVQKLKNEIKIAEKEKDIKKVEKKKEQLAKAMNVLKKYETSFKKREVNM